VPKPIQTYILSEREKEFPGVTEKGEEEDEEERDKVPIPSPLEEEIPKPEKGELGPHYVERLHEQGFTEVVEVTLPADDADPRVGPNEVAYTSPAEGSKVLPSTEVNVEVNPADAPPPVEVSVPTPGTPGIHLPNFAALCTNFPFGVPCWLVHEVEAWSVAGKAPTLGFASWEAHGVSIPATHVELAPLEPLMEYVRPFLVAICSIGIVLLFYRFAKGGTPPGGSNTDEGGDDA
jgi:hypothetical protein